MWNRSSYIFNLLYDHKDSLDSIAASLFENNWLSWQIVSISISIRISIRWQDPNNITDTGARYLV